MASSVPTAAVRVYMDVACFGEMEMEAHMAVGSVPKWKVCKWVTLGRSST